MSPERELGALTGALATMYVVAEGGLDVWKEGPPTALPFGLYDGLFTSETAVIEQVGFMAELSTTTPGVPPS